MNKEGECFGRRERVRDRVGRRKIIGKMEKWKKEAEGKYRERL